MIEELRISLYAQLLGTSGSRFGESGSRPHWTGSRARADRWSFAYGDGLGVGVGVAAGAAIVMQEKTGFWALFGAELTGTGVLPDGIGVGVGLAGVSWLCPSQVTLAMPRLATT
jgi:hypothetical protein